jgi:hypothetical protein
MTEYELVKKLLEIARIKYSDVMHDELTKLIDVIVLDGIECDYVNCPSRAGE